MRLVGLVEGRLEVRWTWLPWWLAAGAVLTGELETLLADIVVLNGVEPTERALDQVHALFVKLLVRRFPIEGLETYLSALSAVREA